MRRERIEKHGISGPRRTGDELDAIEVFVAQRPPVLAGGGRGDGLLTMGEILGLKLDADWIVLSACNTASGQGAGAEAVSGLGRAEALRLAMVALIDGPGRVDDAGRSVFSYAHRIFWAPFSLIGDGGGGTLTG